MTLLGLIIGAILGVTAAGFAGLAWGAILGAASGALLARTIRHTVARAVERAVADAVEPLEARIAALARDRAPVAQALLDPPRAPLRDEMPASLPASPPAPKAESVSGPDVAPAASPGPGMWRQVPPPEPAPGDAPADAANPVDALVAAARDWLLGGNLIVRLGLVVLFVGLAFLANYAAAAGLFPIEIRLALVAAIGLALLGVGFRSRVARPGFGLALQGAGVAIIYLTLFAAARLFDLAPLLAALVLMVAVCGLGCALALLQDSQPLALTAFLGGYAAPLLLGDNSSNVTLLFGYATVLNLAILGIAHRRSWRLLNLLGFLAGFGMAGLVIAGPGPAPFWPAQLYLAACLMIALATAAAYTAGTPGPIGGAVDAGLLFGPALTGFGLEAMLIGDRPFGTAFAALLFAAAYLLTVQMTRRRADHYRLMHEGMLAIAVGFITLAVPLALGARWTSASWALEGAGAWHLGRRQGRWLPRLFGLALQLVAAVLFLAAPAIGAAPAFANAAFLGSVLIAAALLFTAAGLRRSPGDGPLADVEPQLSVPATLAGFGFAWAALAGEALRGLVGPPAVLLAMLAFVGLAVLAQAAAHRRDWPALALPAQVTLAALLLGLAAMWLRGGHALADWAIWLAALALHGLALARAEGQPLVRAGHVGSVWLVTALIADSLWLGIDRAGLWGSSWAGVIGLVAVTTGLAALTLWAGRALPPAQPRRWPLRHHAVAYAWTAALPLAAATWLGAAAVTLGASGRADPLPSLPLCNPVDLAAALALAVLALWRQRLAAAAGPPPLRWLASPAAWAGLGLLAFLTINGAWLRIAHRLWAVPWDGAALLGDFAVQTGLAILWTMLALLLMVAAHRRERRPLWLTGAGLLGLTIVKLVLVDLGNAGGAARVVAFVMVGGLMLVIGYLAPLPPRAPADEAAA